MKIKDIPEGTKYTVDYDEDSIHALLDGIMDADSVWCVLIITSETEGVDGVVLFQPLLFTTEDAEINDADFKRVPNQFPPLIYIDDKEDDTIDNPVVKCPTCGQTGGIMDDWSMLSEGFNGIKKDSPDDIQALECGQCGTIVEY